MAREAEQMIPSGAAAARHLAKPRSIIPFGSVRARTDSPRLISLSVLRESLAGNAFRLALRFKGTFAVAKTGPKKEFVEPYSYHHGDEPPLLSVAGSACGSQRSSPS